MATIRACLPGASAPALRACWRTACRSAPVATCDPLRPGRRLATHGPCLFLFPAGGSGFPEAVAELRVVRRLHARSLTDGQMLPFKRLTQISGIFLVSLAFYVGSYAWFIRSHTLHYFSSDCVEVSDSPFDRTLLFIFYPGLWLDASYIGFYKTGFIIGFARVRGDHDTVYGPDIFPFDSYDGYPQPPEYEQYLLIGASLLCDVAVVSGVAYFLQRLTRMQRSASSETGITGP